MIFNATVRKPSATRAFAPKTRVVRKTSSTTVKAFTVTFETPDGKQEVECDGDTYVIDAAEEAGIDLPYSCRAGACSSCAGKMVSGEIDQSDQSHLSDEQMADGYVLTCVAYPSSDCTIATHKEDELY